MRRAFTLLEMILVIGALTMVSGLLTVWYRNAQIRSDLRSATQQVAQGLGRAKLLSQSEKNDARWGFSTASGVLFRGRTYALRNRAYDESFVMPVTIKVSGLLEVTFAHLTGKPSATGAVILTALNGEQQTVNVTAARAR